MTEKPPKKLTELHCKALGEAARKQWQDASVRDRMIVSMRRAQSLRQAKLKEAKEKEKKNEGA